MSLDGSYTGLQASIADFLNRADLTAAIPDFVTLAEGQIARYLTKNGPVRQMMGRSDATLDDEFETLPDDFMGMRGVYIPNLCHELQFCEPEKIIERKALYPHRTGKPLVYSVVGPEIQIWPFAEGDSYSAEITYWKRPVSLSTLVATNWLLEGHPDIYLYGALTQAAPYLKNDDRITVWGTLFTRAMDDLIAADKVARHAPTLARSPHSYGAP